MSRVDAARKLMSVPGQGAAATGRLFVAKRLHELAKQGQLTAANVEAQAAPVLDDLSDAAHPSAAAEVAAVLRHLQAAK